MKTFQKLIAPVIAFALLAACEGRLPVALRQDIRSENERVQKAARQLRKSEAALNSSLASAPDLFRGASEPAAWKAGISEANANLQAAENDGRELAKLAERNRPDKHIPQLLTDERRFSEAALQKAQSVDQAVAKWLDYQRDPAGFVAKINRERDTIRAFDLAPVTKAVHKAEQDWPAKKLVLESRLSSLSGVERMADAPSRVTPSTLIAEEEALSRQANTLGVEAQELQNACGQLYDSWDKILTDLDRSLDGGKTLYRERLKTVRTHLIDVPLKKSETNSNERWTEVSEASFHAVENDVGMAIAHKDAGQFDSEAQNTPQPPGFSYVASPSVGSNQYGYWTHSGGESFWTFLPQYLILRELLWNHAYRPVAATEYHAYRAAQGRGTTYYGRETPTAPPRYGTHGTFTQKHYADSRYVQSGGFKGSAYAPGGSGSSGSGLLNRLRPEPQAGSAADSDGGRRFGKQPGSAPQGQRFGRSPSSRPAGRSFGRRR
ncbi:MAG: hypothetical protein M3Z09_03960 [Acidobacteriota bacterium]|nr:hypothetical protein [Acidobacteriota bacterium]